MTDEQIQRLEATFWGMTEISSAAISTEQGMVYAVTVQHLSASEWATAQGWESDQADVFMCEGEFQDGPYEGAYYKNSEEHTFYATEKIDEFWYFYYMDYDGNKHGLDW